MFKTNLSMSFKFIVNIDNGVIKYYMNNQLITLIIVQTSDFSILDDGYFRNASCKLN
jgi:hypothetical protein